MHREVDVLDGFIITVQARDIPGEIELLGTCAKGIKQTKELEVVGRPTITATSTVPVPVRMLARPIQAVLFPGFTSSAPFAIDVVLDYATKEE